MHYGRPAHRGRGRGCAPLAADRECWADTGERAPMQADEPEPSESGGDEVTIDAY